MNQNKDQILKNKAILSIFSLFAQSGYGAVLGLAANLVLSITLSPQTFGIYITVLSLISFLNYFSDIGLAASLIQKADVDEEDQKTVFTAQQILIIILLTSGFLLTNVVKNFYQLKAEGIYLYWALLIGFYLASLKTIPSIMLEKKLAFQKIAFVQSVESTIFYLTVIILALLKMDLTSFTVAVILRAMVGLILMYQLSPWKIGLALNFAKLKRLLSFGVSFQTSSLLALFKDDLMTLFLSKSLGFAAMGYIGWAKKWGEALIRIVMDSLNKVLFPLLSKIQTEKEKMGRVLEQLFYYQTLLMAPAIIGLAVIMKNFIFLIPKYQKWEVALPLFYLFSFSSILVTFFSPFINFFNALGKSKISLLFMIFWTGITWIFVPWFIHNWGMIGYPVVHVLIGLTFFIVLLTAKKFVSFNFGKAVLPGLTSAAIMGIGLWLLNTHFATSWINTCLIVGSGVILYNLLLLLIFRINFFNDLTKLFQKNV